MNTRHWGRAIHLDVGAVDWVECTPLGFSQWLWLQAAIKRDGISGRVKESLQVHGKPWSYTASTTRDLFYDLHAGLYATITLKRVGAPEAFG